MFSEKQKKKFAELIRECDRDEEERIYAVTGEDVTGTR